MSTWILLRGLSREARHWGDFPATLAAALPGSTLALIDLPGAGDLHQEASPTRVEGIAARCRAEARSRGLTPPYHLLALSLGGMIAIAWACTQPEELAGCVLINTSVRPFSPFHRRLRPGSYPALLRLLLAADPLRREAAILQLISHLADQRYDVLPAWAAWRRQRATTLANGLRQLLAAARFRAPASPPPVPFLILAGARDRLVHPDCSRRLASAWHAGYAEHPAAGHDLPLDDGPWVAAQTARWLAARSRRS